MDPSTTFLANPDIIAFTNNVLSFLQNQWPVLLSTGSITLGTQGTVSKLSPIEFANASSFGSCTTTCASAVIRNIQGMETLTFSKTNQKAQFYWCGNPKIVIDFAVSAAIGSFTATVDVQGYSAVSGDRVNGLSIGVSNATAFVGSVIVSLPWEPFTMGPQIVYLNDATFSMSIQPIWNGAANSIQVPNVGLRNVINDAIQECLNSTSAAIVDGLRGSVSNQLQRYYAFESPKFVPKPTKLWVPMQQSRPATASCQANQPLVIPVGGCDPCDTCCQCFTQQKCSGECVSCACLNCQGIANPIWIAFVICVGLITLSFAYKWILPWTLSKLGFHVTFI